MSDRQCFGCMLFESEVCGDPVLATCFFDGVGGKPHDWRDSDELPARERQGEAEET